ncbi:MAG: hypothetical protein CBC35_00030 [Planctomycetes bacterium TMED75]|nr:hypothetical protein [Planctomycetaceae bacterium]OUU97072.1 MAG: hypothetical protein CBC35_00030 [Planctomycetes bacterium TMED75]
MSQNPTPKLPGPPRSDLPSDEQKVVYVQRPVKQVVQPDPQPSATRFTIVVCGLLLVILGLLLSLGAVGLRLGFEPAFGLPRINLSLMDAGILGISMIREVPQVVLASGNQFILLPLLGLVFIAIPLAFLALARPRVPGAPLPRSGVVFLSVSGALIGCLVGITSFVWLLIPFRTNLLASIPANFSEYLESWRPDLILICSIDVFAFLSTTLWLILLHRLPLQGLGWSWLRISMLFIALCLFTGLGVSLGLNQGLSTPRPVVVDTQKATGTLLMGEVGSTHLLLSETESRTFESTLVNAPLSCSGHRSIDEMIQSPTR